jgi:hypothetical protein
MLMGCGNASGCEADSGWSPFAAWLEEKFREKDSAWEARIDAAAADLTARLAHLNATCCKDADSLAAIVAAANARAESSRPHSHPSGSSAGWAESMLSPEVGCFGRLASMVGVGSGSRNVLTREVGGLVFGESLMDSFTRCLLWFGSLGLG